MYNISELSKMCEHLNEQEQKAVKAQRESVKYKQCEYLKEKIGEQFNAVISNVKDFGIFVEILENGCEGFVSKERLEGENIHIDEENFCVNNFNTGESNWLGDEICIEVANVNMTRKQIDFKIITGSESKTHLIYSD